MQKKRLIRQHLKKLKHTFNESQHTWSGKTSFHVGRWDLSSRWSNRFSNVWDDASFRGALVPRKGRIEQRGFKFLQRDAVHFSAIKSGSWICLGIYFLIFVYFEYFIIKEKSTSTLAHERTLLLTSASVNISMKRNWNSFLKSWFSVVGRVSHTFLVLGIQQVLINAYWIEIVSAIPRIPCLVPQTEDFNIPCTYPFHQHSSDWTRNIQLISS